MNVKKTARIILGIEVVGLVAATAAAIAGVPFAAVVACIIGLFLIIDSAVYAAKF